MYGIQLTSLPYLYYIVYIDVKENFYIFEIFSHHVRKSLKLCQKKHFPVNFSAFSKKNSAGLRL